MRKLTLAAFIAVFAVATATFNANYITLSTDNAYIMQALDNGFRTTKEKEFFDGWTLIVNSQIRPNISAYKTIFKEKIFLFDEGLTNQSHPSVNGTLYSLKAPIIKMIDARAAAVGANVAKGATGAILYKGIEDLIALYDELALFMNPFFLKSPSDWYTVVELVNKAKLLASKFSLHVTSGGFGGNDIFGFLLSLSATSTNIDLLPLTNTLGELFHASDKLGTVVFPAYDPLYAGFTGLPAGLSTNLPTTTAEKQYINTTRATAASTAAPLVQLTKNLNRTVTGEDKGVVANVTGSASSRRLLAVVTLTVQQAAATFCAQQGLTVAVQSVCTRGLADLSSFNNAIAGYNTFQNVDPNQFSPARWAVLLQQVQGAATLARTLQSAGSFGGILTAMQQSGNPLFSAAAVTGVADLDSAIALVNASGEPSDDLPFGAGEIGATIVGSFGGVALLINVIQNAVFMEDNFADGGPDPSAPQLFPNGVDDLTAPLFNGKQVDATALTKESAVGFTAQL